MSWAVAAPAALAAMLLGAACTREAAPGPIVRPEGVSASSGEPTTRAESGAASARAAPSSDIAAHGADLAASSASPSPSGSVPPSGSALPSASAALASTIDTVDAGAKVPDPANKSLPPLKSADLDERAAHLLVAITQGEPGMADDFFFPKAPFIPLKDVADPGRYFDQLLSTYHRDVRTLRAEQKDWSSATFTSFELGTTPTWVAPGKEYNKIGYYRTFGGKLRYRVGDKAKEIKVSTIISWDGRWYVTHLSPIHH